MVVLNLIITGIPSILTDKSQLQNWKEVLNLIITGIPSIHFKKHYKDILNTGFKPYYNWNTFNTQTTNVLEISVICFKPYYNWNTFNT